MRLNYIPPNNSTNSDHRHISLALADHMILKIFSLKIDSPFFYCVFLLELVIVFPFSFEGDACVLANGIKAFRFMLIFVVLVIFICFIENLNFSTNI